MSDMLTESPQRILDQQSSGPQLNAEAAFLVFPT